MTPETKRQIDDIRRAIRRGGQIGHLFDVPVDFRPKGDRVLNLPHPTITTGFEPTPIYDQLRKERGIDPAPNPSLFRTPPADELRRLSREMRLSMMVTPYITDPSKVFVISGVA